MQTVTMKNFEIDDYFIRIKNKNNWKNVKGMLDIPIWKSTDSKIEDDDYKNKLKEIRNKKKLPKPLKDERIKKIKAERFYKELDKVRITYGTFLRAIGDLICEKGDPPSLTAQSIKTKFESLAKEEYVIFSNKLNEIIKDNEFRDVASKINIDDYRKRIKNAKQRDLEKLRNMNKKSGIIVSKKIDALNTWLNSIYPAVFIKKVGENYKLLVYSAEGIEGETEYFCSEKNRERFSEIVNENKREILKLKNNFMSIVGLHGMEYVLKPPPDKKKEFFPVSGPYKYNFDDEWVVRRLEVSYIIMDINEKENTIQILKGDRASGKTVIARNVGYELMNKGWKVFHISATNLENQISLITKSISNYLEVISNKSLIIVENIHRDMNASLTFINEVLKVERSTRFLLTYFELSDVNLTRDTKNIFSRCSEIKLKRADFVSIAESIIKNYFNHQNKEIKEEFLKNFTKNSDNIIMEAEGNLWVLSYFLKAWTPSKGIDIEIVYDEVNKDIDELDKEFDKKHNLCGVKEALLTLAPFSIFEVGVTHSFLNENYGIIKIKSKTLKKLIEYGEIVKENGYYYIPHSSLAELYIKTMFRECEKGYKDTLFDLLNQLNLADFSGNDEEFILEIIRTYLKAHPKNYVELIKQISTHEYTYLHALGSKPLITFGKILQDVDTAQALIKMIKEEKDENFIRCLDAINFAIRYTWMMEYSSVDIPDKILFMETDAEEFMKKINVVNRLVSIIKNESNVKRIGDYQRVSLPYGYSKDFYNSYLNELDLSNLISKLKNKKTNLDDAFYVLYQLYEMDKNILNEIKAIIRYKTRAGISMRELGACCKMIDYLNIGYEYNENQNLIKYLINLTDIDQLIQKMGTEKLSNLSISFPYIKEHIIGIETRLKTIINILSIKVNKEKDITEIILLLSRVAFLGAEFSAKLLSQIDTKRIISMIEKVDRFKVFSDLLFIPHGHNPFEERIEAARLISGELKAKKLLSVEEIKKINRRIENFLELSGSSPKNYLF